MGGGDPDAAHPVTGVDRPAADGLAHRPSQVNFILTNLVWNMAV